MKLLYIDTDESFAAPLKRSLERGGIGVELFADGREAFDAARAEPPDAIVLAVELGDKLTGGYTWCQKLRKNDATRNVPLVLVSSQATPETFEQHRKLKNRADEYLQKPFDAAGLLEALGHHVELPISALEAVTAPEEEPLAADDDLARLDEAFDLLTADPGKPVAAAAEEGFEIALAEDLPAPEPTAAGADEAVPRPPRGPPGATPGSRNSGPSSPPSSRGSRRASASWRRPPRRSRPRAPPSAVATATTSSSATSRAARRRRSSGFART
jgi:CheY-like chemotaxis protein